MVLLHPPTQELQTIKHLQGKLRQYELKAVFQLLIIRDDNHSASASNSRAGTLPMVVVQKLTFNGNNQYIWLMGGDTVTTLGRAIDVDPMSNWACGAIMLDASSLSPNFDVDPSQSSVLDYGEPSSPTTANFDVIEACWNMVSATPPSSEWSHRIGSAPNYGLPTTLGMFTAFTSNLVVQTVTRRRQGLVWPASDSGLTLAAPNLATDLLNPYVWARRRTDGVLQWAQHYQTSTKYESPSQSSHIHHH